MKNHFIAIGVLAFALMSPPAAIAADRYADIKTVGVVSAIGTELHLTAIGSLHLGERTIPFSPGDWNLDSTVVAWVTAALSPRFAVKPMTYDAQQLGACERIKRCVPALTTANAVDAIVVVHRDYGADWYNYQQLYGLGVEYYRGLLGPLYGVFAAYRVTVFDATGKELDHGSAYFPGGSFFAGKPSFSKVDESFWVEKPETLTAEQRMRIKEYLTRLVRVTLPTALNNANLVAKPEQISFDDVNAMVAGTKPIPYFSEVSSTAGQ